MELRDEKLNARMSKNQGLRGEFPGALKFLVWRPEPNHFFNWSLDPCFGCGALSTKTVSVKFGAQCFEIPKIQSFEFPDPVVFVF